MTPSPFGQELAAKLKFVRNAGFIADGRRGFYTVTEVDEEELCDRESVWLFERDGSGAQRLAEELGDVSSPAPSPDGRFLALTAAVDGEQQICLVPIDGGPPRTLTTLPQGVGTGAVWSPDGTAIAFTAGPAERRDPSLPYRVDRTVYRMDGMGYVEDAIQDLYVVEVESGSIRQLTSDRSMNSDPRWSPDGRTLAYFVSFPPDRPWTFLPELHLIDVETAESRVLSSDWGGVFRAEWCADDRIAFVGCPVDDGVLSAQKIDLWTIDVGTGELECRSPSLPTNVGWYIIQSDLPVIYDLASPRLRVHGDVAYVGGQVGGDVVIYRVALSGPESVELVVEEEGASAYFVDSDPEDGVLYLATSCVEPPELMLGPTRITALNDAVLAEVARPDVRKLEVTAPDGVRSEAWALTPPGEDGPWPTVLYVHGGPVNVAFGTTYLIDFQLLVGAGFAVVYSNFRGSGGYGTEFMEKYLTGEVAPCAVDHLAAVDAAVDAGIADPDRVGISGVSHGGYATCWLLGTSDRFKAGVAENAGTNLATSWGVSDVGESYSKARYGGTPIELPDVYREHSPLTYAPNCTAPLLFIIGEADLRCHPAESEQYYRAIRSNGVTTEMLRMPNASHAGSFVGPVPARLAQNEALVDWFTRYLK